MTTVLSLPYDISFFLQGAMDAANTRVAGLVAARNISLPSGIAGSRAKARVAPAASVTYTVKVNEIEKGTIVFGAGQTNGTITWLSNVTVAAGDVLTVVTPASVETSIRDVSIALVGAALAPNTPMV
jgi:hypothetical protein